MEAHPGIMEAHPGMIKAHPGIMEAHPGAMEAHPGALKVQLGVRYARGDLFKVASFFFKFLKIIISSNHGLKTGNCSHTGNRLSHMVFRHVPRWFFHTRG
jgi:hypothetical protein